MIAKNICISLPTVIIAAIVAVFVITTDSFAQKVPPARCNESVFSPCICNKTTPKDIKYRPKLKACGNNAAIVLTGDWSRSFSVVLRDKLNRDRFPASGYNGCTPAQAGGVAPPARCSAYKCQKTYRSKGKYVCCFGNRGSDRILSKATRMTIKLKDVPGSSADPLARVCLNKFNPKLPLN